MILQAVSLLVLWYELTLVVADSKTVANFDTMMLHFINGELPVVGETVASLQEYRFAPKHQAGLKPVLSRRRSMEETVDEKK